MASMYSWDFEGEYFVDNFYEDLAWGFRLFDILVLDYPYDILLCLSISFFSILFVSVYIYILRVTTMPLYELIMITKCSQPAVSVNILKNATHFICQQGGNVRDVKILADRYQSINPDY